MGYKFRIWFTGLCHFVLNRDPNALCRLCVVLPDARGKGHCDHVASIYHVDRVMDHCGHARIRVGKEILPSPLRRQRVAFGFTQRDPIPVPGNTDVLSEGLLWMGDIAGGFSDQSDGIVSLDPPPTVTAQILLENLEVKYEDGISVQRKWEIPATLTGDDPPVARKVADPMFVEFTNVEGVSLTVFSMNGTEKERHDLPDVKEVVIANRCEKEDALGEGRWRQEGEQQISWVQVDKDFKFNFDMLSSASHSAIKRFMGTEEMVFPVPESPLLTIKVAEHMCIRADSVPPIEEVLKFLQLPRGAGEKWWGTGTGSGGDCLGSQGLVRFVDLDDYILAARPQETVQALEARSASEPQSLEEPGAKLPPVPPKPETWKR